MSRRRGKGENEITREVKKRCSASGEDPCAVLAELLRQAKIAGEEERVHKVKVAQKYLGCRNIRKRESE